MDTRLTGPSQALRISFGLMATLAGLDKFFNILADWGHYVSPLAAQMLPFSTGVLMSIVGIVEFGVGMAILVIAPRLGAYVASAWLVLVAANLAIGGFLDIAVRDVILSVAAFTLAKLIEAGAADVAASTARVETARRHATA